MSFCARYIAPGQTIGTAGATPVTADVYLLEVVGATPCTGEAFEVHIGQSPFDLTTEEAAAIGGAMLLVMGVAFVLRMVRVLLEQRVTSSDD